MSQKSSSPKIAEPCENPGEVSRSNHLCHVSSSAAPLKDSSSSLPSCEFKGIPSVNPRFQGGIPNFMENLREVD